MLTTPDTSNRAIYYIPENIFEHKQKPVPPHRFDAELDALLEPGRPSVVIPLDISHLLDTVSPATTPMLLVRYLLVRAGETLTTEFCSSGEVYCVISGSGTTSCGDTLIGWGPHDVFALPGIGAKIHAPSDGDAILFLVTDEPALAYLHVQPGSTPAIEPVHYPWQKIAAHLDAVYGRNAG
jgi:gentisate 1,2-dioxygenase